MRVKKVMIWLCAGVCSLGSFVAAAQSMSQPVTAEQLGVAQCQVYPLTNHEDVILAVTPMPDPFAEPHNIPITSIFTITRSIESGNFTYLSWLNNHASNDELEVAFSDEGILGAGFIEADPPPGDSMAQAQLNHRLEVGDWVGGVPSNRSVIDRIWDWHVTNQSMMILPLNDQVEGIGTSRKYRISHFVTARLLSFKTSGTDRYLRFGLVATQTSYTCFRYASPTTVGTENTFTPLMPFHSSHPQLLWDFGDGTTSTAITATHTYAQPGTYLVKLIHAQSHLTAAQASITVVANLPTPSPTLVPTITATVEPTATSTPEPTATLAPTVTATVSPTPSPRWRMWIPMLQQDL